MIEQFNPVWELDKLKFNHSPFLPPSTIRMLVVGPSGCGKSHLVLTMLLLPNFIDYNHLHICTPSISQSEYQLIINGLKLKLHKHHIQNLFTHQHKFNIRNPVKLVEEVSSQLKEKDKWKDINITTYEDTNQLPAPKDLDNTKKNLFIIDDSMLLNQCKIANLFVYGRPLNVSVIYLAQNYFQLPLTIRKNANFLILFKLLPSDVQSLYTTLTSNDFKTCTDFKTFMEQGLSKPHSFIIVNRDVNDVNKKYSIGFGNYYNLNMANYMTSERKSDDELMNDKKRAVASEDKLREAISSIKNSNIGLLQTSSKLFEPVTKAVESRATKEQTIHQELQDISQKLSESAVKDADLLFGLYQESYFKDDEYIIGAIKHFHAVTAQNDKGKDRDYWYHRIVLDVEKKDIYIYPYILPEYNDDETVLNVPPRNVVPMKLTKSLADVLFKDITDVDNETKGEYMNIIRLCIGPLLESLARASQLPDVVSDVINRVELFKSNRKFMKWIVPAYKIKVKFQPKRGTGVCPLHNLNSKEKEPAIQRLMVLLGSAQAGNKEANLEEFSKLLDHFYESKFIGKKAYKVLMDRFNQE